MGDFEIFLIFAIELAKGQVDKEPLALFLFFFKDLHANFVFLPFQLSCVAHNNY